MKPSKYLYKDFLRQIKEILIGITKLPDAEKGAVVVETAKRTYSFYLRIAGGSMFGMMLGYTYVILFSTDAKMYGNYWYLFLTIPMAILGLYMLITEQKKNSKRLSK